MVLMHLKEQLCHKTPGQGSARFHSISELLFAVPRLGDVRIRKVKMYHLTGVRAPDGEQPEVRLFEP